MSATSFAQEENDDSGPTPPERPIEFGGTATNIIEGTDDEFLVEPPRDYGGITTPQPVILSARMLENGPIITDGIVWRIYNSRPDETGELSLVAKSDDATASFAIPPGEYILHMAYGVAQTSDTLYVEPGPNSRTMTFEIGALQLTSQISGNFDIDPSLLTFDVYEDTPNGRLNVVQGLNPNELVHLNAGVYSIVSKFGNINAEARSELRVDAGQITEATLYQRAADIHLRLVSELGGEAIADVDWKVTDASGTQLYTSTGAFPSLVLAEGEYIVIAKLGDRVFKKNFSVSPTSQQSVEILTTANEIVQDPPTEPAETTPKP